MDKSFEKGNFVKFELQSILDHLSKGYNLPESFVFRIPLPNGSFYNKNYSLSELADFIHLKQGASPNFVLENTNTETSLFRVKQDLLRYQLPEVLLNQISSLLNPYNKLNLTERNVSLEVSGNHLENQPVSPVNSLEEKEVMNRLMEDPKFIHFTRDSLSGDFFTSVFVGGSDETILNSYLRQFKEQVESLGRFPDVRHTLDPRITKMINSQDLSLYIIQPVFLDINKLRDSKSNMMAYGIVIKIQASGSREGEVSYWVLIPKDEKEIQTVILNNPKILLDLYETKFRRNLLAVNPVSIQKGQSLSLGDNPFFIEAFPSYDHLKLEYHEPSKDFWEKNKKESF